MVKRHESVEDGLVRLHEEKILTLEELYGITKKDVHLKRVKTKSGKWLEYFKNPSYKRQRLPKKGDTSIFSTLMPVMPQEGLKVEIMFPEFTCRCPRTGHPDFATITLRYVPNQRCLELKSLKYYLSSFRDEGHFHEEVVSLIYEDIKRVLQTGRLQVIGDFAVRGGTHPIITKGSWEDEKLISI